MTGVGVAAATSLVPALAATFSEKRMREYLKLSPAYDVHSIGEAFPASRCFCLVGSDHASYSLVRSVAGGFSDGLVKQDRAYIVSEGGSMLMVSISGTAVVVE